MRENRKMLLVGINAALLGGVIGVAHASLVASDNVTNNPPYSGYINFNGTQRRFRLRTLERHQCLRLHRRRFHLV